MTSKQHLELIERTNKALQGVEDGAIERIEAALESSYRRLEKQILAKYPQYTATAQPGLLATQRALLLMDEIKDLLPLFNAGLGEQIQKEFKKLLKTASSEGITLSSELMRLSAGDEFVKSTATVPIESVAIAAEQAYKRLEKYGADFAGKSTALITQGLVQGWGAQRIVPGLRQQLGITKGKAQMIARTETMSAHNGAAQQNYRDNGFSHFQWLATGDDRLCPLCGARNGNVYELGKVPIPGHPQCRCFPLVWSKELAGERLINNKWMEDFRAQGLKELEATGKSPDSGLMPFEKAMGMEKPPEPVWKPARTIAQSGLTGNSENFTSLAERPKARAGQHDSVIASGKKTIGAKQLKALDSALGDGSKLIAKLQAQLAEIDTEFDRLLDESDDMDAVFRSPLGQQRGQLQRQLSEEQEKDRIKALSTMQDIRAGLLKGSKLTAEEAASAAAQVKILKAATREMSEVDLRVNIAEFHQITNGKAVPSFKKMIRDEDRAYASDGIVNIGLNGDYAAVQETLWHELGHHIEFANRTSAQTSLSWIQARASGKVQPLNQIIGREQFDADEVAYPDQFISPYVGKVYDENMNSVDSTEVLSMGIQHFTDAENMLKLYRRDPEHFLLTVGLLQ